MSVTVREGNVRLRVVPNPKRIRGRRVVDWEFRWRDGAGRRRRLKRAKQSDAIAEARRIAKELAAGRSAELSCGDVASFRAGITNLFGCGMSIEAATAEFAEIKRRLAGRGNPLDAVDFFIKHHAIGNSDKSIADVVDELIAAKRAAKVSERHLDDLTSRLGRLKREVQCKIGDLTAPVMDKWLQGLNCAPRTHSNYRGALSNLLTFAVGRKYLPPTFVEMLYVSIPKRDDEEVEIFTIEEMRLILAHARPSILPAILLGAFAGLRTSETAKVRWENIHWKRSLISVPRDTKTGARLVPLFDNLREWLEPLAGQGLIVGVKPNTVTNGMQDIAEKANADLVGQHSRQTFRWKRNGLRHSFVSYWASFEHDLWKISERTGHSIKILKSEYQRADVFPETGRAWFEIRPVSGPAQLHLKFDHTRKPCPLPAPSEICDAKTAHKAP